MSADASSQPAASSPDAPVADGADADDVSRRPVGRRTFIKGVTVGAVGVGSGAVGINYGSQEAEAVGPLAPFAIVAFAGVAGVSYMGWDPDLDFLGGDDKSNFTGASALHSAVYEEGLEMMSVDERVMTSIENNIANSKTVALAKGKAAVVEAMNAEKSESEAQTAMQEAIDAYYAKIQENILTHYETQVQQFRHQLESVLNHSNLNSYDVFEEREHQNSRWLPSSSSTGASEWSQPTDYSSDVTLIDGSTRTVNGFETSKDTTHTFAYPPEGGEGTPGGSNHPALVAFKDSSGSFEPWNMYRFIEAFDSIAPERDDVNSTLSGFVTDVYNAYEPGEIPTEDLVDPITAATELSQNYDGYQAQGAHAAMLGIPTTAEQSVHMTVHRDDGDIELWTDLYTEHVPTDGDGNEIGFEVDTTYSPGNWSEPLYIAYEYTTDSDGSTDTNTTDTNTTETDDGGTSTQTDFVQLEDDFTIDTIENKDGETVDSFQTEERVNQTADVSNLQEELDQIRQTQIEMQEEAQSGGGGLLSSFSIGGIPGVGVVALIGAAALALFGQND